MDTRPVVRQSVRYGGDYFWVRHDEAYPGVFDKSRGQNVSDGRLQGRICNVDLDYDASGIGSRLHLDGRSAATGQATRSFTHTEGDVRMTLEMTESAPGRRRIAGGKPPTAAVGDFHDIDLDVAPDRLVGSIGMRRFTLAAEGTAWCGR